MTATSAGEQSRLDRLQAAAGALRIPLDAAASDRLLRYLALLQRWNRVYNLTAVRDADAMLTHHLIDCLAIVPALRRQAGSGGGSLRILDVGSGGGLPGAVLAMIDGDWSVDCVDAAAKKVSFIRQVAAELGLPNLHGLHSRVEHLRTGPYRLITSRAFASLAAFTAASAPLLADGGQWLAMKGRRPTDELAALPESIDMFHVEPLQVPELRAERCLVWMRRRAR